MSTCTRVHQPNKVRRSQFKGLISQERNLSLGCPKRSGFARACRLPPNNWEGYPSEAFGADLRTMNPDPSRSSGDHWTSTPRAKISFPGSMGTTTSHQPPQAVMLTSMK
ncbi:hypothetical protein JDV02_008315 [Purpureocillium takamizusanense]|uniref:Uncharacterized protein n=1 Tax=Purpureocillium takamizusanense TaxID=2060973 RepID=A0A9Q8QPI4_9HYPO|nr:uncharacterized protein JDV02_008315 [Purpureocillium takamizusanense]UNI22424.1 hypothetical protein JDV02_008315 [Purpureocillium takamizusanense]